MIGVFVLKDDTQKHISIILKGIIYTVYAALFYILFKYVLIYLVPFIVAYVLSLVIEPVVRFFERLKIKRGFSVAISIVIVFGSFITFSIFAITQIVLELVKLVNSLPKYSAKLYLSIDSLIEKGQTLYLKLPPEAINVAQDIIKTAIGTLSSVLKSTTTSLINTITAVPGIMIMLLIITIATFFLTKDKILIQKFIQRQLPQKAATKLNSFKNNVLISLVGFIKAQIILLTLTFCESLIGLNILGINYAFLLAIFIALVDILPILGTGSVYVPWAIVSAISGNYRLAISLIILYGIIVIVRYMVEPKVVGEQLGIHPVIALMSMFLGLKLLGVAGVILGPTIIVILKACQNSGILPKFK